MQKEQSKAEQSRGKHNREYAVGNSKHSSSSEENFLDFIVYVLVRVGVVVVVFFFNILIRRKIRDKLIITVVIMMMHNYKHE